MIYNVLHQKTAMRWYVETEDYQSILSRFPTHLGFLVVRIDVVTADEASAQADKLGLTGSGARITHDDAIDSE